jgi:polyhydroxybutyrate depolymerase
MKYFTVTLFLIALSFTCLAQQTITYTITHDGLQREYILYVPASYTGNDSVPLLFNFHAFGGFAQQQMVYGDFRPIADSAGFLIAHPQGTGDEGQRIWNIGIDSLTVDDVGFTEAMIDSIDAEYNIDRDRVYSTGHSMGAFFSIYLAGQLSEKIAAIASVCGSMTQVMYDSSAPAHPTPYLEIHGTADPLVPYNGTNPLYLPIPDVLQYWVDYNNCNTTPIITQLPDIDTTDGSTVEHHVYEGGDNGVHVEHFKVIGGGHTWPGTPGGNMDIDGSEEIWNFLSRYDINGLIGGTTGIEPGNISQTPATFLLAQNYPNPFNPSTRIEFSLTADASVTLKVFDILGQEVTTLVNSNLGAGNHAVDFDASLLNSGVYFYKIDAQAINGESFTQVRKMMLTK